MKKITSRGFVLVETLVVTIFIGVVLIFLYIQFSNLNSSYNDSFKYNTVEGLYALKDVRNYILTDSSALEKIKKELNINNYIDISDCTLFNDKDYCNRLLELEKIKKIIVANNLEDYDGILDKKNNSKEFIKFLSKINNKSSYPYRIIASFNNKTFATIRFGD